MIEYIITEIDYCCCMWLDCWFSLQGPCVYSTQCLQTAYLPGQVKKSQRNTASESIACQALGPAPIIGCPNLMWAIVATNITRARAPDPSFRRIPSSTKTPPANISSPAISPVICGGTAVPSHMVPTIVQASCPPTRMPAPCKAMSQPTTTRMMSSQVSNPQYFFQAFMKYVKR